MNRNTKCLSHDVVERLLKWCRCIAAHELKRIVTDIFLNLFVRLSPVVPNAHYSFIRVDLVDMVNLVKVPAYHQVANPFVIRSLDFDDVDLGDFHGGLFL